jgi:CDP-diacylglycerol--glycerol-3-phosphate 3-phosphatidyltransferase
MLRKFLHWLKLVLEKLDHKRDQILFYFIKKFWPRWIKPNHLTYLRLIIGTLLFVLLFYYEVENKNLIIALFVVGVLTDLFDGSVARCLDMKTKFGAIIDPAADRIIILPIAIYSLITDHQWLLFLILCSEIINGLASAYAMAYNVDSYPNIFAKTKMVLQSFALGLVLIVWPKSPGIIIIDILWISMVLMILSIFLKVIDIYSKLNIKNLANKQIKIKK